MNFVSLKWLTAGKTQVNNVPLSYVLFVLYAICLFGIAHKALLELDQKLVPTGDAFTYAVFFYQVLNEAHRDLGAAIALIANKNYNWLQDFLILLFSPVLDNERATLIVINYFCFLISTLLIFKTALAGKVPQFWAFLTTLLFAAMPWNFHLLIDINLASLMLEPVFINAYLCATLLLCWFLFNPRSRTIAIAAGISLGAVICSRWNGFVYVLMPLAGFGLAALLRMLFAKARPGIAALTNFAMLVAICALIAGLYFQFTYHAIFGYGSAVVHSLSFDLQRKLAGAAWFLLNVPGLAIAGQFFPPNVARTAPYAVLLTILAHAVVITSAVFGFRKIQSDEPSDVLVGAVGLIGATIFYADFALALTTFAGYSSDPRFRSIHDVAPAIAGLICSALSFFWALLSAKNVPQLNYRTLYILVTLLIGLNSARIVQSSLRTVFDEASLRTYGRLAASLNDSCASDIFKETYLPNEEMKSFSLRFRAATADKFAYFFWYDLFNFQIVDYYAAQSDLAPLRLLPQRTDQDRFVWDATYDAQLATPQSWFRDFLKHVLGHADYIVIPERLDDFERMWPSPMVAYHQDIAAAVNSPDIAPDYLVWGIVEENVRVLVLKRRGAGEKDDDLEPFPRTWGTPAQVIGRSFKGALVAARKPVVRLDTVADPELLYSYSNYNVLGVGDLYLGVAAELGNKINVPAILANAAPRPPAADFIFEKDPAVLEQRIDACSKDTFDPHMPPQQFFAYGNYNVVRVGRQYVGVAQGVGKIDFAAVLANAAPRPAATRFIVAHDTLSLKAKIDSFARLGAFARAMAFATAAK